MTHVLVVDNHDSFVFTLVGYLEDLGAQVSVLEADSLDESRLDDLMASYDGVMISPGPGTPHDAGASVALVGACADTGTPLLGVCLGHQAIAVAYGATVDHAPELKHGMASTIEHDGTGLFAEAASPLTVGRYHSLAVVPGTMPAELVVTAQTAGGVIMAIEHSRLPVWGVQFHPESVLTESGHLMLANWLSACGLHTAPERALTLSA